MRVAVIGGGIQGTCVAMELATRGAEVDLIEANDSLMDAASRHNEGKIHLGFVYANDRSLRTARLMYQGATAFAPLMRRWLGNRFDEIPVSTPFNYAVHKQSMLSADELEHSYAQIARMMHGVSGPCAYFEVEDPEVVVRLGGSDHGYGPAVDTVFSTREIAIDPRPLADLIEKRVVDTDQIQVHTGTRATAIRADDRRVEVVTEEGVRRSMGPYQHIVNCAWAGRPALDASAGLVLDRPWTFRMKYFLLGTAPRGMPALPTTTVVLGSFGDIVHYGGGEYYLSWYPSGRIGWSTELTPPSWPTRPDGATAVRIAGETLRNLESVVPGLSKLMKQGTDASQVLGGVIFSLGDTDIDDPNSEFHNRSEVGLSSLGTYHSVDTGKYTTAPLFAVEAADRVTGVS